MRGILFVLILASMMTAVTATTLCSYRGPETSDDMLRLSNFTVSGSSSLEEGDDITVKFTLQSYGQDTITLGPKGIFAGATDPDDDGAPFGKDYDGDSLRPGAYATVTFTTTLDKAGTWRVWPSYQIVSGRTYRVGPSEWHACTLKVTEAARDSDGDGIPDDRDNCPEKSNQDQRDKDDDGKGDSCDTCDDRDFDQDGVKNCKDECPDEIGPADNNGCPAQETDGDGDGIADGRDNCPDKANPGQGDIDGDGKGDACDSCDDRDTDRDGVKNCDDKCPSEPGTPSNSGCAAPAPPRTTIITLPAIGGGPATLSVPLVKDGLAGPLFPEGVQDGDNDSVINMLDECPNTPPGEYVFENGCRCHDTDPEMDPYAKGSLEWVEKAPNLMGGTGGKNKTGLGYTLTHEFIEDECGYTGNASHVREYYCDPAYENGTSDYPYLGWTQGCEYGCSGGACKRPYACATKGGGTCADGVQNQDETGVDCGGKCPPCNTVCTTGTKYAPADTPCTSYYNTDMHRVNFTWTDSDLEYTCRWYEICHPDLDFVIEEAADCCSSVTEEEIGAMPDPALCRSALRDSRDNCRRCTGLYIIRGLGTYARWMVGYHEVGPLFANATPTAERLINDYKIGVCRDYSLATATLLRKDGYPRDDIGNWCDGAHCYNVVRLPGDAKWHVVDTTGNSFDINLGGLPPSGYKYCDNLNESKWCFFVNLSGTTYDYYTHAIPDVDAYWSAVEGGGTYTYNHATSCWGPGLRMFLPQSGPGLAVGRDNYRIPEFAPSINDLVGCN